MNKPTSNTFWLLKMAWRESRTHRVKLALFLSAIVIGVAAQVSISSLRDNLTQSIDNQSKELLGADLEVRHTAPFDTVLNGFLERRFDQGAHMVRFASMVSADSGFTRLSQIFAQSKRHYGRGLFWCYNGHSGKCSGAKRGDDGLSFCNLACIIDSS